MTARSAIQYVAMILVLAPGLTSEADDNIGGNESGNYFFKISFSQKGTVFALPETDSTLIYLNGDDVDKSTGEILLGKRPFLNKSGFYCANQFYPLDSIEGIFVRPGPEGQNEIVFGRKPFSTSAKYRSRKQNRIAVLENLSIEREQFVRGSVVGFWSDLQIEGEINEDVIAIYGNIIVGEEAVIRGNVIAVEGAIDVAKSATIYGSVQSSMDKRKRSFDRWRKWYRRDRYFSPIVKFHYNRVDGATPYLGVGFMDEDSVLPKIHIYGGYGFESERWRYNVCVEKTFSGATPLTIGGNIYRKLAACDDWIISHKENTAFALLATEDYKDYFEAEGGYGFIRGRFFNMLGVEGGILGEKYKWLEGRRRLWSLLGGSKVFPENFFWLQGDNRQMGIGEIDSRELTSFIAKISFNTPKPEELFGGSFWNAWIEYELAPDKWNNFYDFAKYLGSVGRRQGFKGKHGINARLVYGSSEGRLPAHRKFFLGGLGSLHGYKYKEYIGDKFWFGEIEYGVKFPNSDLVGWAFYELGQAAPTGTRLRDSEIKHSLGIGLSFGEDIRLNIARRLDQSEASPEITVRLDGLL
jgi:hypothetical protein